MSHVIDALGSFEVFNILFKLDDISLLSALNILENDTTLLHRVLLQMPFLNWQFAPRAHLRSLRTILFEMRR